MSATTVLDFFTRSMARRVIAVVALLYGIRMLGLFMVMPVLSLYVDRLPGASYLMVGLALGIYGLSQALLQWPFGYLADRFGYRIMVLVGLGLFALGSLVAMLADTIYGIIIGRLLQGTGALAGILLACIGHWVAKDRQPLAYAMIGIAIGASFIASLMLGPLVNELWGLSGLFAFNLVLASLGIVLVYGQLPDVKGAQAVSGSATGLLKENGVLLLCAGIFVLHLILSAVFVMLPLLLIVDYGLTADRHWLLYAGTLLCSVLVVFPVLMRARSQSIALIPASLLLLAVLLAMSLETLSRWQFIALLVLYFAAFNWLEAVLPSLFSSRFGRATRARGMSLYATAQFLGSFVGGVAGGFILWRWQPVILLWFCAVLVCLWLLALLFSSGYSRGLAEQR